MAISWKQFDQQRWQFLRYARREFRRALSRQIAPVIQALQDKGTHDVEGALTLLMDDKPMEDAFIKVYRRVGGYFGGLTFRQYAKSEADSWTQEVINHIMTDGYEKINGINETNIKKIRSIISDGTQRGLGVDEISRNIRSGVGSMQRATLIARTEVIAASNRGSIEGARATGLPMKKLWLSTPDERTRPEHVSVQPVETVDALFRVGNDEMKYPGDISNGAEPSNTINCRCAVGYDPY